MARRRGFFTRIIAAIRHTFSRAPIEREPPAGIPVTPEPPREPGGGGGLFEPGGISGTPVTGVTDFDDPPGRESLSFDFMLSGYLPLQGDFNQDYVNLEGGSGDLDSLPWSDLDYFVIAVTEPGRDTYYVTIVGPFDDYEDFLDHVKQWWEEGS